MRNLTQEKRVRNLTTREKHLLLRACESEPAALLLEDATSVDVAETLVVGRFLGKVEVRGDAAYRLTELGRAALAAQEAVAA
jgi:hypothetical protein